MLLKDERGMMAIGVALMLIVVLPFLGEPCGSTACLN